MSGPLHFIKHVLSIINNNDPELVKAQFRVLSSQMPIMYSILLVNAWALALVFSSTAPTWLWLYIPLGFTALCAVRLVGWWYSRHRIPTAEVAYKALKQTKILSVILVAILCSWSLALHPYGDTSMQANVAFFMAITGVGVIICLQQVPIAAHIVTIGISVPFVTHFFSTGLISFMAMSIDVALVAVTLLIVVFVQFRHFSDAVDARSKLEAANRENYRLANLDSLTGLNNRRRFFSQLNQTIEKAKIDESRFAVGIIDLDRFKPINDLYGHAVGDRLLQEVAKRITATLDETSVIARLGGDEFAIIMPHDHDNDELMGQGHQICQALNEPFELAEATIQISASMGVVVFPDLAQSAQELYVRADYALCNRKRAQRGGVALFADQHILEIEQTTRIEQALNDADLEEELSIHFQPIVDAQFQKTIAFEALARWTSPVLGNVSPGEFIPVAERSGKVKALTPVLLKKALSCAACWPEDIRLSFNLSTHDLSSMESLLKIVALVEKSGVAPSRIDFEITETAMVYDFEQVKRSVGILKGLGCGLALDDFGTGFSSLTQLHALPLTKIKIDRSFVTDLNSNPASYKIVKSLLALSRDMDIDCVVEGVETQDEMQALSQLGGRLIQGYYYSKPLPESEVSNFSPSSADAPSQQAANS